MEYYSFVMLFFRIRSVFEISIQKRKGPRKCIFDFGLAAFFIHVAVQDESFF